MKRDRSIGVALGLLLLLAACVSPGEPFQRAPEHHRTHRFWSDRLPTDSSPFAFLLDRLRLALRSDDSGSAPALSEAQALASFQALRDGDGVWWLGHATVLVQIGGYRVVVDPVRARVVSPFPALGPRRHVPAPWSAGYLPPLAALVITHDHFDHLEQPTLAAITASQPVACLVPLRAGPLTPADCNEIREMDWGDRWQREGLAITFQPARHESGRGLLDRNETLWGSYLIEAGGRRVYIGGDTGYAPHFRAIGEAHGPIALAVLNLGGYLPRFSNATVHTDPEETAQAFRDLRAQRLLLVHWGTYTLGLEHTDEAIREVRDALGADSARLLSAQVGEAVRF